MNILVIGNGFDLAHGLPTGYKDFLEFIKTFKEVYEDKVLQSKHKELDDTADLSITPTRFTDCIENMIAQNRKIADELHELSRVNLWLEYFGKVTLKEGWIDFESEISKVVQVMDELRILRNEINKKGYGKPVELQEYQSEVLNNVFKSNIVTLTGGYPVEDKKEEILLELNRVTRCLEIYLSYFINKKDIGIVLPDIQHIKFDKVLSFNYTNTFERIYDLNEEQNIEYDYIHGKAEIEKNINTCNLVLGIDEYLSDSDKDNDNEFIQFKKFYQRIYKRTGNTYINWVKGIEETVDGMDMYAEKINIYILGHSLDVTDKDILYRLLTARNAETTIFYHNQEALGNQIANLVKVLGEDELISRVHGKYASVIFKEQSRPIKKEQE